MYGSEWRTCGLGAVVALLLGAGGGFGWHYLADGVGAVGVASAVGLSAQREAHGPLSSCPPGSREGPVPDVPVLPHANNQPDTTPASSTVRITHAAHASRARQVTAPGQRDGGQRVAF